MFQLIFSFFFLNHRVHDIVYNVVHWNCSMQACCISQQSCTLCNEAHVYTTLYNGVKTYMMAQRPPRNNYQMRYNGVKTFASSISPGRRSLARFRRQYLSPCLQVNRPRWLHCESLIHHCLPDTSYPRDAPGTKPNPLFTTRSGGVQASGHKAAITRIPRLIRKRWERSWPLLQQQRCYRLLAIC